MTSVTMRQLLEAGIHFGHQTRRWNPKMAKFIFGQRNGIYIIDLQKTMQQLQKACALVRDTVASGKSVLFVGTKRQAQEPVEREATRCGMYYVNTRWLGGTLTNFTTVKNSVRTLLRYDGMEESGAFDKLSKKESSRLRKYHTKLKRNLSGVKAMDTLPGVMFVVDSKKETIAVREANRLGIPCIAIVDTNCDPDTVPIPIPGNDDAIRAVTLFCGAIADAALEGLGEAEKIQAQAKARKGQPTQASQADVTDQTDPDDQTDADDAETDNENVEGEE